MYCKIILLPLLSSFADLKLFTSQKFFNFVIKMDFIKRMAVELYKIFALILIHVTYFIFYYFFNSIKFVMSPVLLINTMRILPADFLFTKGEINHF